MSEIQFVYRSKKLNRFSIERVFDVVKRELSKTYKVSTFTLSYAGADPITIVRNIFSLIPSNGIRHITGDAHYLAIRNGKRSLLTIHDLGSAVESNVLKRFYIKLFWFWLPALFVKRISVISEFTKGELSKLIPFAKNKIRVVPNPVDPGFTFRPKSEISDHPIILFMGTKANKNLERCINAITGMSVRLQIIGKLTDKQVALLKKESIDYMNAFDLSDEKIKKAYRDCDIVCFPSTYEGFGMPIIEAQATGRPVVTSDLGAMKEVAGDSACLVDPYSVNSIREGVQKVINDETYRNQLVKKGLENIKRFKIEAIAEKYLELYKEIEKN
jgi:glycosyltransferase involved in cell wall biosynthesis